MSIESRLYKSLKEMLMHVKTSYDPTYTLTTTTTPTQAMRAAADAMDLKDKQIEEARQAIRDFESPSKQKDVE